MYLTDSDIDNDNDINNNDRIIGIVKSFDDTKGIYYLDKLIIDGSRNISVRVENEGRLWRFCDERFQEYIRIMNGYIGVVIHVSYGGFSIYDKYGCLYDTTDRHNHLLIEKSNEFINSDNNYQIVYIPSYMIKYYYIREYDGIESVDLLVDKYKMDKIIQIRKGGKTASDQLAEIDKILLKDIKILKY